MRARLPVWRPRHGFRQRRAAFEGLGAEYGGFGLGSPMLFQDQGRSRASSARRLREEGLLDDHQIGQGKQGVELRGVLGEAAGAHFAMAEPILDYVEGMLDPGPHLRQRPLHRLRQIPQTFGPSFDNAALDRDVPEPAPAEAGETARS